MESKKEISYLFIKQYESYSNIELILNYRNIIELYYFI